MLYYMGLFFLVCAVSMDGFIVGMTYGLRTIRVPFLSICIIMCCSGIVVFLAMTIGTALSSTLSPALTSNIGGIILLCIGLFSFVNSLRAKKQTAMPIPNASPTKQKHLFATISSVLSTPSQADLDCSGRISLAESFLLGIALALDAFGAGFGAAMLGYTALLTTTLIAIMSGAFLFTGIQIGTMLAQNKMIQKLVYLPSCILIFIGIATLL